MITIEKEGIGTLGTLYTDDCDMTITTGENSTVVVVSSGTITIDGGTGYALSNGDMWVIAGQSNCGRSRVSEMTAEQQSTYAGEFTNVKMMNQYVSKTTYANLDAGVNTMLVNPNNSDEFGFEVSFFKRINDVDNTKQLYCVKHGYGASSLATQWQPTYDPLELFFQAMVNRISQTCTNAQADGHTPKLRGFIWMQGEQDAASQTDANNYFNNILEHFAYFTWEMQKLVKAGKLNAESLGYKKILCKIKRFNGDYEDTVNQAFIDYAAMPLNNAVTVETEDLTLKDSIHWDASSQIELGNRIYEKMFE